ncbi:14004_t:CDS:2, partial [Gigaspora margarita]
MTKNKYYKPTSAEINEIINSTILENTQKATAKWVKILENWWHNVGYNYGIETVTDKDQLEREMIEFILGIRHHPEGTNVFNISNRKEFPHLWEALNGKIKKLKKEDLFEFTSNSGIHFKKYSQKNDQDGVDGNSDALIVPVPPDPK